MSSDSESDPSLPRALLNTAPRVGAVIKVLWRHGFGGALAGDRTWPEPDQVKDALNELGLVFVKFGQVLSTRADLLPEAYISALETLQDHVTPVPIEAIRATIVSELGDAPENLFQSFEAEPLASASVAQVHAATLKDGRDVVVKVQRPDLDELVHQDLLVLAQVAALFERGARRLRPYDLPALVRDFRHQLEDELDFRSESSHIGRFEGLLAKEDGLWIPSAIDEFSSSRVLTMERSHGVRLEQYVEANPEEAPKLARRIGRLFIRQIFRHGLFHADPHPGNFFVLEDGRLCLHDFGMIGEVDEMTREALVNLVDATVAGDGRAATRAYLDLGLLPRDVDRDSLQVEVSRLVSDIRSRPLAEVSVGEALQSLASLGGRHKIRNPGVIMMLSRVFITLEGVLARLDPSLSFIELFGEAFREALDRRLSPDRLRRDAFLALQAMDKLAREAPDDVRRILQSWGDGKLGQVIVGLESGEASRRRSEARSDRQTLAAGFITVAGAVLSVGAADNTHSFGLALTIGGLGILVYRFFKGS
jgi:ubiquinone biosynthesis protein